MLCRAKAICASKIRSFAGAKGGEPFAGEFVAGADEVETENAGWRESDWDFFGGAILGRLAWRSSGGSAVCSEDFSLCRQIQTHTAAPAAMSAQ
jgi:hypothetical protein